MFPVTTVTLKTAVDQVGRSDGAFDVLPVLSFHVECVVRLDKMN
jgi:hypothetical protein